MSRRKSEYFHIEMFFRVDGIDGCQDYSMHAPTREKAFSMAWSAFNWEAHELGLATLGGQCIARMAIVTATSGAAMGKRARVEISQAVQP